MAPRVVAHDLHPDYLSTQYAHERRVRAAASAARGRAAPSRPHRQRDGRAQPGGPVIGVAFDGTGYGPDGTVWGGEFLVGCHGRLRAGGHLATVAMPGGEQAIHQPWRMAAAWLQQLYGDEWLDWPLPSGRECAGGRRDLRQMMMRGVNSPLTSSMGRLFDAVAALLGVRDEAAMKDRPPSSWKPGGPRRLGPMPTNLAGRQADPARPVFADCWPTCGPVCRCR